MSAQSNWREVRDTAVAVAAYRINRGVLTARDLSDALDEAYRAGSRDGLAPVLDLIGWWETDGTAERKAAAERIRAALAEESA